ncbi:MAG TPA: MmcQ/YjbR family DNA-binding protein [Micrococcaceae bacterium]|nr:MmcQ/YjbR family DNA-binding protein [Micrococcaceae bacterium]
MSERATPATPDESDGDAAGSAGLRRRRRQASQLIFDTVAAEFGGRPEVSRAPMFGSSGLRLGGKFFAFVGGDGQLVIKLPAEEAAALVAAGAAEPVRAGRHATREWVGVTARDGCAPEWHRLVAEAHTYASTRTA